MRARPLKVYEFGLVDYRDSGRLPDENQIKVCTAWLMLHAVPTKHVSHTHDSYGHKHRVERWTESTGPHKLSDDAGHHWISGYYYVSNGALIEAARRLGYVVAPTFAGSPNALFNFTLKRRRR